MESVVEFGMPEELAEFAVGFEGVGAEFVFLLRERVAGVGGAGVVGLAGVLYGGVAGLGVACAGKCGGGGSIGARSVERPGIEASSKDDQDQVGVVARARERVAAPVFEGVLGVEDGVALVAAQVEVGDVAVFGFNEDGLGGGEDFGEKWFLFGGGEGRKAKEKHGHQDAGQRAVWDEQHDWGMVHRGGCRAGGCGLAADAPVGRTGWRWESDVYPARDG